MTLPVALALVAALVILTAVAGIVMRRREGHRRDAGAVTVTTTDLDPAERGSRATLVQFSTEVCARCPQVRRMLRAIADEHDDLSHVELDLTHRPELSARYRVLQTPTTFLVDDTGTVRARFNGVPQRHALTEALAGV
ncbi:MAG: thioredoxin family protein [Actinomycetota bacterium]